MISSIHHFFNKQSVFDSCPENCLSFPKKSPPKNCLAIVQQISINFYCLNVQTFSTLPQFITGSPRVCNAHFSTDKSKSEHFSQISYAEKGFQPVLAGDYLIFVSYSPRKLFRNCLTNQRFLWRLFKFLIVCRYKKV